MNEDLVSIIIPLHNAENYLSVTLDSVVAQSYKNWECIIIDDGSVDRSKQIAQTFCECDSRFMYCYQENLGASAARNNGLNFAKGTYIQYLDSDDVILPEKIEQMLAANLQLTDKKIILYCDMILGTSNNIYEELPLLFSLNLGHDINFNDVYNRYGLGFGIIPSNFLFPRYVLEGVLWNTNLGPHEDMDYLLQIIDNGYNLRFLPSTLVIYRNTPSSYSKSIGKSFESSYRVLSLWMVKKNDFFFTFIKRCSIIYTKSILLFIMGRSDKVFHPRFGIKLTFSQQLFSLLIYPSTVLIISSEFLKIIFVKLKKIKKKK